MHVSTGVRRDQKSTLDLLEQELQVVVNFEFNLGPLEEQSMLLATEPSFYPQDQCFLENSFYWTPGLCQSSRT